MFLAVAALAAAIVGPAAAQTVTPDAQRSADHIRAHMGFLASDLLEGREAGSVGFDIAANYVASQFTQLGLKPAGGNGSWFQKVPLVSSRLTQEGRFVLRGKDGAATPLAFGQDVVAIGLPGPAERTVSAPLVFVGYGVVAPERGRDDYKGLDVKGKIVVALTGAPASYQTEERAYYANRDTKRAAAAQRGAVGMILVRTPKEEARSNFASLARGWQRWAMTWQASDGTPYDPAPSVLPLGLMSVQGATRLFAGAPKTFEQVAAEAESAKAAPSRFALPDVLDVTLTSETRVVQSENVVGLLEGSDPKLKDEVVVLSAHLDHIGVGPPDARGDTINNGALDNAAGVATTLEVARAFQESGRRPRRSILFLTVTGEEKGLLGAQYFARNPTVPLPSIAANVDLDMPILLFDFTDVVAFGADRSGVGPAVQRAAARLNIALSPDTIPEEGIFTRSDHFRFVEVGVPAVYLMTGFANGGETFHRGFLAGCYHHPCDDLSQAIDYNAGAKFARLNYEITRELADADARPLWNKGDFFGVKFAPPALIADH